MPGVVDVVDIVDVVGVGFGLLHVGPQPLIEAFVPYFSSGLVASRTGRTGV